MNLPAWRIPHTVGLSLVSEEERRLFSDSWRSVGGRALEIGTLDGCSAAQVARQNPEHDVWSVDTFELVPASINNWLSNQTVNMRLFVGTSKMLADVLPRHFFSIAFIDGDHTYEACRVDCESCLYLVDPSGVILVHDYACECFREQIPPATMVLEADGWECKRTVGISTAYFRKDAV